MFAKSIGEVIGCVAIKSIYWDVLRLALKTTRGEETERVLKERLGVSTIDEFMKMSKEEYDELHKNRTTKTLRA